MGDKNYTSYLENESDIEKMARYEAIDKMVADFEAGNSIANILNNQLEYFPPIELFSEEMVSKIVNAELSGHLNKEKLSYLLNYGSIYHNRFDDMFHALSLMQIAEDEIDRITTLCTNPSDFDKYKKAIFEQQDVINNSIQDLINIRYQGRSLDASDAFMLANIKASLRKPNESYNKGLFSVDEILGNEPISEQKEFIVSGLVKGYSEEQLLEIQKGKDADIDTSFYMNTEYSVETMKLAREKLEYIKAQEAKLNNITNLGKSTNLLNDNQKELATDIRNRIARTQKELMELLPDLDASRFLKADFDVPVVSKETTDMVITNMAKLKETGLYNEEQLAVLRDGLSFNHNIAIYCKPVFSAETMKELQKNVGKIIEKEAAIKEARALPPTEENNELLLRLEYDLDGLWLDTLPMNAPPELKQSRFLEDNTMALVDEIAKQTKNPLLSAGAQDVTKMSLDEVLHELHTLNEHVNLSLTVMKDEINTLQKAREVETDYKEAANTILEAYRIFDDTEYSLKKNKAELQQNATKILSGLHKNSTGIAPEVVSAVEEAYLASEKLLDEAIKHIKDLSLQLELQTEETSNSIVSAIKETGDNAISFIKDKLALLTARAQLFSSHAFDKEADVYRKTGRVLKNISKNITNVDKVIYEGKLRLKNAVHALKGESSERPAYVSSGLASKVCSFLEGCYKNQFDLAKASQERADSLKTKSSLILLEKGNPSNSKKEQDEEEDLDNRRGTTFFGR